MKEKRSIIKCDYCNETVFIWPTESTDVTGVVLCSICFLDPVAKERAIQKNPRKGHRIPNESQS